MRLTLAFIMLLGVLAIAPALARSQTPASAGQSTAPGAQATAQGARRIAPKSGHCQQSAAQTQRSKEPPAPAASKAQTVILNECDHRDPYQAAAQPNRHQRHRMPGNQMQDQKINKLVAPPMQQLPGVEIDQAGATGTETDVTIRGSTAAQTLTLIDGVDVNTGSTGGFDFATLTTDNIEQVEVVRGSGGALYGSSAIGGVVNVISKQGQGAPQFQPVVGGRQSRHRAAGLHRQRRAEQSRLVPDRFHINRPRAFARSTTATTISPARCAWTTS